MSDTSDLIERAKQTADEARKVGAETTRLVKTSRDIQHWTARVQGRIAGETGAFLPFGRQSNCLLALLPSAEFNRLSPLLQKIRFTTKAVLHRINSPIDYVYFPVSGVLSASLIMRGGDTIEVATIGNEGMTGLTAAFGNGISPNDVVVQIPGDGLRIEVTAFRAEMKRDGLLRDILMGYQSVSTVQNTFQIACNGLHTVDKRCCRRLLNAQDRIGSDILPLTHDSLALSLGVRRATVTEELGALQASGILDCGRGQVTILDRPKLRLRACECYEAVNQEFARLFETRDGGVRWPGAWDDNSACRNAGEDPAR